MNKECFFCQISLRKIPAYMLRENEYCLAFLDINPVSRGHTLIITKKHYENLAEIEQIYWNNTLPILKELINTLKKTLPGIKGFNIISNMGSEAYQSVFHLHIHLIPKYKKEQGFIWNVKGSDEKNKTDLEEIMLKITLNKANEKNYAK